MANLTMLTLDDPVDQSLFTINGNFTALNDELAAKASQNHEHDASAIVSGVLSPARLGAGTPDNTKFLRGDGAWVFVQPSQWVSGTAGAIFYSSGKVGLGNDSPEELLHLASSIGTKMLVEASADQPFNSADLVLKAWSGSSICSGGILRGYSARGTKSNPGATQGQDRLLQLAAYGHSGSGVLMGGVFRFIAGTTWSSSNGQTDIHIDLNGPNETGLPAKFRFEGVGAFTIFQSSQTPASPAASAEAKIYVKGNKLVVQFNDAGTVRYKWLDLTGTGVTWQHSTTAP